MSPCVGEVVMHVTSVFPSAVSVCEDVAKPAIFLLSRSTEKRGSSMTKSMKNFRPAAILALAVLCSPLLLSTGCGANGIDSVVSAQQSYSNASLTGTYSFNEVGSTNGLWHDGNGTLQFDGNGNVKGTMTNYYVGANPCQFSIAGTYTLSSSASGTASLTTTSTNSNCVGSAGTVNLQAAQQGQSLAFAETDGQRLDTGTALKQ